MKKVCFISPKAYPLFDPSVDETFGGAEVQLYQLGIALVQRGDFDVHFMVGDYGQKIQQKIKGITIWNSLQGGAAASIVNFFSIFRKISADVYVQRTLTPQSGLMALFAWFFNMKFVYMAAHDSDTDGTHSIKKRFLALPLAELVYRFADVVIVQNAYQQKMIKKRFGRDVEILHSSYTIDDFDPATGEYVLWVGRSEDWKQPGIFLDLAKRNPDFQFLMICPPSATSPELSEQIRMQAEAMKNVDFVSSVPFDEIDSYFESARIFVNTSTQEGFPNTFIQAAKHGVPILSLSVNPNDFLENEQCGFFCYNDIDKLHSRLVELVGDAELVSRIGMNGYQYAKKYHDIDVNIETFLNLVISNEF